MTFDAPAITHHRVWLARLLSRIGAASVIAAVTLGCVALAFDEREAWFAPLLMVASFWFFPYLASYTAWFILGRRAGRVAVDDAALELSTFVRIPRTEISSAYLIERPNGIFVEVVRSNGDVFGIDVSDRATGAALITALGFGPGGARQTIALGGRARRLLHLPIALGAYQVASMTSTIVLVFVGFRFVALSFVWIAGVCAVLYPVFKRWTRAPFLEIGDDGISVVRGMRREFHPRATIRELRMKPKTTSLAVGTSTGGFLVSGVLLDGDRARAAMMAQAARWADPVAMPSRTGSFLREGRDLGAWQEQLRVRIATGGYRDAGAISVDDAEAVLRSPAAPPDARLGAALALAAAGERVRVASAVAPVTDGDLREALASIAEGKDEPKKLAMVLGR